MRWVLKAQRVPEQPQLTQLLEVIISSEKLFFFLEMH